MTDRQVDLRPQLVPVERETLSDQILERIVNYITDHNLTPGTRLPTERELAEELGVGRSSLREALKVLVALGVVTTSRRGTFVGEGGSSVVTRPLSWGLLLNANSASEVIEARRTVEVALARLAALRSTDQDRIVMKTQIDKLEKAGDIDEFVEADLGFHLAVARGAHNEVLLHILSTFQHVMRAWMRKALPKDQPELGFREHDAIWRSIERKDSDAAAKAMSEHLGAASERLLAALESNRSLGD